MRITPSQKSTFSRLSGLSYCSAAIFSLQKSITQRAPLPRIRSYSGMARLTFGHSPRLEVPYSDCRTPCSREGQP